MTTVYVLTEGVIFKGVFSSYDEAERYLINLDGVYPEDYTIEPHYLDGPDILWSE